ncbi:MAG: hypothetical protein JWM78_409 [Verrucomicrobiaceae bacterium]|nr:hypothetical protein [Verrucomicrobiaceae bacterium]
MINSTASAPIAAWIEGIGILGPGISSWPQLQALFTAQENYASAKTVVPVAELLPPAERRRAVQMVRLTLAAGLEAVTHSRLNAAALPSIFSSSSGDSQNMHAICETLASSEREISPTRFHNSVHNAASGYWSIATGSTAASTALCAFDGSFGAALLEGLGWLATEKTPILLVVYDLDYPEPLRSLRPVPDAFCAAFVLAPQRSENSLASITAHLAVDVSANKLHVPELDNLRKTIPAARCLPLLDALANSRSESVVLEYIEQSSLIVDVQICR